MSNIIINNDDNEIEVDFSEEEVLYKNTMNFIDDMIEYNNKADAKEAIKARVRMLLENRDSVEESLFDRLDEAWDEVEELQIKYSKSLDDSIKDKNASIEMAKDYNELAKKYNSLLLEHNELLRKYIDLVKKPRTIFGKIKAMIKNIYKGE